MNREILKNVLRILTLRCDESSQLMSRAQETQLSRTERWALRLHLLICKSCRKYKKQLKILHDVLSRISDSHTYEHAGPPPLDPAQSKSLQNRLSKNIREILDSM